MTLRLFEEPGAAAESPAQAPLAARVLFAFWAALVALIPAVVAAYSSIRVMNMFRNLVNAEQAGSEAILGNFHVSNFPLVLAFAVSGLLALGIALVLTMNPQHRLAAVGLPFSIAVPILAAMPAAFLWSAETRVIDLLAGKITDPSIVGFAQTISYLLISGVVSGLLVQGIVVVAGLVSICTPTRLRNDPLSAPRAFVWLVSGVLLLAFAGAYFILI